MNKCTDSRVIFVVQYRDRSEVNQSSCNDLSRSAYDDSHTTLAHVHSSFTDGCRLCTDLVHMGV